MRRVASAAVPLALITLTSCAQEAPHREYADRPAPPRRAPVVMVIGDSFTVGHRGVPGERTYAAAVARTLGWQIITAGASGTGLVEPGRAGKDFRAAFERELSWRPAPDLVIVSGGHNDRRHHPSVIADGVADLLGRIESHWPGVPAALVGPLWVGDPPKAAVGVRDAMARAAAEMEVPFIDPVGERWIGGDPGDGRSEAARFLLPDGVHPTYAGHRRLAERLTDALRRLGLTLTGPIPDLLRPGPTGVVLPGTAVRPERAGRPAEPDRHGADRQGPDRQGPDRREPDRRPPDHQGP
ncbi:SGNH/GDSL hydrolase family protein [Bailinhaonella thermotolerans]|uniref:SGNH/GDSL hydrolase family protein n=1 Tax=Bailinhaonella thermotolerans TaxID=1070861 RepID=A0A3A4AQI9_9ACTN|nr:SGNH/GDSL hydrolase family protein [Bailinhaonella thermotolerans]RJL30839.1 SGNH/GDSL hydrolase family protein [Bailinhaonella thermotolerans]